MRHLHVVAAVSAVAFCFELPMRHKEMTPCFQNKGEVTNTWLYWLKLKYQILFILKILKNLGLCYYSFSGLLHLSRIKSEPVRFNSFESSYLTHIDDGLQTWIRIQIKTKVGGKWNDWIYTLSIYFLEKTNVFKFTGFMEKMTAKSWTLITDEKYSVWLDRLLLKKRKLSVLNHWAFEECHCDHR